MNNDDVLTLRQVARLLQTHTSTIYKLVQAGEIPAFKLGRNWRFSRASIERWMRQLEEREQI